MGLYPFARDGQRKTPRQLAQAQGHSHSDAERLLAAAEKAFGPFQGLIK